MSKRTMSSTLLVSMLVGVAVNAQSPQQKKKPHHTVPAKPAAPQQIAVVAAPTLGENCAHGAGGALGTVAVITGVGCLVDLFFSGGTLCMTYLTTAAANAPMAAATGCAVGAFGSHPGASAGLAAAPHIELQP